MIKRVLTYLAAALLLTACGNSYQYNECVETDPSGWHKDSVARFTPCIMDTLSRYNVLVTVRHNTKFPYQSFWMFVKSTSPDSVVVRDTIECYLADNRGKFLGRGVSVYEMPVLYMQKIRFPKAGDYTFEIEQGMRDTAIVGIQNICLTIERYK